MFTHAGRPDMAAAHPGHADAVVLLYNVLGFQLHAVQVDENEEVSNGFQTPTSPPKSELALQKGFRRRTWTGPAWLDNVTSTGHVSHPPTHLHCCYWCPVSVKPGRTNFLPVTYVRTDGDLSVQSSCHHLLLPACIIGMA